MADWVATLPAGNRPLRVGDDDIRENNQALEERLAQFMYFPENPFDSTQNVLKIPSGADDLARTADIANPRVGNLYFREDLQLLGFHDGSEWRAGHCMVGTREDRLAVTSPDVGTLWYDTDEELIFLWDGTVWLDFQSEGAGFSEAETTYQDTLAAAETRYIVQSALDTDFVVTRSIPEFGSFALRIDAAVQIFSIPTGSSGITGGMLLIEDPGVSDIETYYPLAQAYWVEDRLGSDYLYMSKVVSGLTNDVDYDIKLWVSTQRAGFVLGPYDAAGGSDDPPHYIRTDLVRW